MVDHSVHLGPRLKLALPVRERRERREHEEGAAHLIGLGLGLGLEHEKGPRTWQGTVSAVGAVGA